MKTPTCPVCKAPLDTVTEITYAKVPTVNGELRVSLRHEEVICTAFQCPKCNADLGEYIDIID